MVQRGDDARVRCHLTWKTWPGMRTSDLEFLGDAVLGAMVAKQIYLTAFPLEDEEGLLTQRKAGKWSAARH